MVDRSPLQPGPATDHYHNTLGVDEHEPSGGEGNYSPPIPQSDVTGLEDDLDAKVGNPLTADLDADGHTIKNLADPDDPDDAATKQYVVDSVENAIEALPVSVVVASGNVWTPDTPVTEGDLIDEGDEVWRAIGDGTTGDDPPSFNVPGVNPPDDVPDNDFIWQFLGRIGEVPYARIAGTLFVFKAANIPDLNAVAIASGSDGFDGAVVHGVADPVDPQDAANKDYVDALLTIAPDPPASPSSDPGTTGQFMVDSAATTTGTFKIRFVVPSGPQAGTHDTTVLTPDNAGGYLEDYPAVINAAVGGAGNLANLVSDYGTFQYDFAEDLAFMAVVVSIIDDTTDPSVGLFNNIVGVDPSSDPGDVRPNGALWSAVSGGVYQRVADDWVGPLQVGGA